MAENRGSWGGFYRPPETASPVKTLSPAEIKALGLDLVCPLKKLSKLGACVSNITQIAVETQKHSSIGKNA